MKKARKVNSIDERIAIFFMEMILSCLFSSQTGREENISAKKCSQTTSSPESFLNMNWKCLSFFLSSFLRVGAVVWEAA